MEDTIGNQRAIGCPDLQDFRDLSWISNPNLVKDDMLVTLDASIAEVLDRMTICEVKLDHIEDPAKRRNIAAELDSLRLRLSAVDLPKPALDLIPLLRASNNENFIQIEQVFACDGVGDFGPAYVQAARAAFRANAQRASFKRRINLMLDSEIVEEKTY